MVGQSRHRQQGEYRGRIGKREPSLLAGGHSPLAKLRDDFADRLVLADQDPHVVVCGRIDDRRDLIELRLVIDLAAFSGQRLQAGVSHPVGVMGLVRVERPTGDGVGDLVQIVVTCPVTEDLVDRVDHLRSRPKTLRELLAGQTVEL